MVKWIHSGPLPWSLQNSRLPIQLPMYLSAYHPNKFALYNRICPGDIHDLALTNLSGPNSLSSLGSERTVNGKERHGVSCHSLPQNTYRATCLVRHTHTNQDNNESKLACPDPGNLAVSRSWSWTVLR